MGLLRESIRPSSDLRNKYNEISTVLKTGDEACIMTVNGRGDTVCMGNRVAYGTKQLRQTSRLRYR